MRFGGWLGEMEGAEGLPVSSFALLSDCGFILLISKKKCCVLSRR